jgi:hypothetical protein
MGIPAILTAATPGCLVRASLVVKDQGRGARSARVTDVEGVSINPKYALMGSFG